jgi:hypothetical protein
MAAALHELVDSIPSYATEQVTPLLLCMHLWDYWREEARGKIMFHNEKCRWATNVLTEKLPNAISKHDSKISSTDVEEVNNLQAKSQLQRAFLVISQRQMEWML